MMPFDISEVFKISEWVNKITEVSPIKCSDSVSKKTFEDQSFTKSAFPKNDKIFLPQRIQQDIQKNIKFGANLNEHNKFSDRFFDF